MFMSLTFSSSSIYYNTSLYTFHYTERRTFYTALSHSQSQNNMSPLSDRLKKRYHSKRARQYTCALQHCQGLKINNLQYSQSNEQQGNICIYTNTQLLARFDTGRNNSAIMNGSAKTHTKNTTQFVRCNRTVKSKCQHRSTRQTQHRRWGQWSRCRSSHESHPSPPLPCRPNSSCPDFLW